MKEGEKKEKEEELLNPDPTYSQKIASIFPLGFKRWLQIMIQKFVWSQFWMTTPLKEEEKPLSMHDDDTKVKNK